MPTESQHISQWKRNRQLLQTDAHRDYPEWKITVAFYCALHAVEALFAHKGWQRCKDHAGRNKFLGDKSNKLLKIWHSYKALFDASHDARYACPEVGKRFNAAVQKDLIQRCLQTVESEVIQMMGLSRNDFPLLEVDAASGRVSQKKSDVPSAPSPPG
jgi:hypothetical protein